MQAISGKKTQASYVTALTIQPFEWEAIEVVIEDAPVMMQLFENDEHRGGYQGGDWRSELLVDPTNLTLEKVGGVRFRTNPDAPNLAGTVFAVARTKDDPVVAGLKPREHDKFFGPQAFNALTDIAAGAGLVKVFDSSVPDIWGAVYLGLSCAPFGGAADWHFQVVWTRGGTKVAVADFYTFDLPDTAADPASEIIVLPVLGDAFTLYARHNAGGTKSLTTHAYLVNMPAFSYWGTSQSAALLHVEGQPLPVGASPFNLPLYAGQASLILTAGGIGAGATVALDLTGKDEAGTVISRGISNLLTAAATGTLRGGGALDLLPHRNTMVVTNNGVAGTLWLTLIAQRN